MTKNREGEKGVKEAENSGHLNHLYMTCCILRVMKREKGTRRRRTDVRRRRKNRRGRRDVGYVTSV